MCWCWLHTSYVQSRHYFQLRRDEKRILLQSKNLNKSPFPAWRFEIWLFEGWLFIKLSYTTLRHPSPPMFWLHSSCVHRMAWKRRALAYKKKSKQICKVLTILYTRGLNASNLQGETSPVYPEFRHQQSRKEVFWQIVKSMLHQKILCRMLSTGRTKVKAGDQHLLLATTDKPPTKQTDQRSILFFFVHLNTVSSAYWPHSAQAWQSITGSRYALSSWEGKNEKSCNGRASREKGNKAASRLSMQRRTRRYLVGDQVQPQAITGDRSTHTFIPSWNFSFDATRPTRAQTQNPPYFSVTTVKWRSYPHDPTHLGFIFSQLLFCWARET